MQRVRKDIENVYKAHKNWDIDSPFIVHLARVAELSLLPIIPAYMLFE
jgi:hypothetical protein